MKPLRRYMLRKNDAPYEGWVLVEEGKKRPLVCFANKRAAISKGALSRELGPEGGSVRICDVKGVIKEERTFPRLRDPRKTRG